MENCPICRDDQLYDGPISLRNLKLEEIVKSLQVSDLASESIQIGATGAKPSKVHKDTNQETRQVSVQLNVVADDENVTSEQYCAPCFPWVFHNIETTIRARKCPRPLQILKWILHLIFWLIASIVWLAAFSVIVGFIGGILFGIGYLFYLGNVFSVFLGVIGVIFVLICLGIFCGLVDEKFNWGVCEYLADTSS